MGYTHYWERPKELDQEKFSAFSKDVRIIFEASRTIKILLSVDSIKNPEPLADDEQICFNGKGEGSHETFHLPRIFEPLEWMKPSEAGLYFQFCKTFRKPYDLTVMVVLIAFKHHFDNVIVTSDGGDSEWTPAKLLCNEIFKYGLYFKLDQEITLNPEKVYGLKIIEINDLSELKDLSNVHDEN